MTTKAWEEWLEEMEGEFCFFTNNEPLDKKNPLLIYGGKEIAQLKKSHRNPTGEFAVMCRAGSIDKHLKSDQNQPKNREWTKHVKKTAVETAFHNSTSSDNEFFSRAVKHLKQVKKIKSGDHYR